MKLNGGNEKIIGRESVDYRLRRRRERESCRKMGMIVEQ